MFELKSMFEIALVGVEPPRLTATISLTEFPKIEFVIATLSIVLAEESIVIKVVSPVGVNVKSSNVTSFAVIVCSPIIVTPSLPSKVIDLSIVKSSV